MTDQKQRLRALDQLDTPDVWERARSMEPAGDIGPTIEHAARKRAVVIVVAFAVFAAAATFAWQGFRSPSSPIPAGQPDAISSTVLWPERTQSELAASQAAVDGGDPATLWRTDPGQVALRFAEDVMGWGDPGGSYGVAILSEKPATPSVQATLTRSELPCPSPAPGTTPTCPPPYENETLTMRQEGTTGPTGVWSVAQVRGDELHLDLQPGQEVRNGAVITGDITFPDTAPAVDGFSAASGLHVGTTPDCPMLYGAEVHQGDGPLMTVSVPPDSLSGSECGTTPGAYAWIATAGVSQRRGDVAIDPLNTNDGSRPTFFALTVVPVRIAIPENGSPSGPRPTAYPAGASVVPRTGIAYLRAPAGTHPETSEDDALRAAGTRDGPGVSVQLVYAWSDTQRIVSTGEPLVNDRLVWLIIQTGVGCPVPGGPPGSATQCSKPTRLRSVGLVDANTGEFLMGGTG